jgi:ABC-2 type transport system ATP-binding protein
MTFGLSSVSVRLGGRTVLDGITLAVEPGTVAAVVGGDGAGKSTLLRALVGLVPVDGGAVRAPERHRIGYLPSSSGSWAALTVAQNLDFVAGVYGVPADQLPRRRGELIDGAALHDAADRPASTLSGGMRRKLGFSMAAVHVPDLLVLDEPSTGVDPVSRIDLWRLVTRAASAGAAVVMTTTYLDEAERASSILVLDEGRALAQGSADEVLASLRGTVVRTHDPVRREWSWRRGTDVHELWPEGAQPSVGEPIEPDLEDVVIALALQRRAAS